MEKEIAAFMKRQMELEKAAGKKEKVQVCIKPNPYHNDLMPEEFQNYIKAEYERLRKQAATYGELDKLISERKKAISASEKERPTIKSQVDN